MKSFVISLCIAICILGGGAVFTFYMDNISRELCNCNNEIRMLLEAKDYEKAATAADELYSIVIDKKIVLASTIDHSVIDNIERNIAELRSYTKSSQDFDALAKCEVLEVIFKHLPRNYEIKMENIL